VEEDIPELPVVRQHLIGLVCGGLQSLNIPGRTCDGVDQCLSLEIKGVVGPKCPSSSSEPLEWDIEEDNGQESGGG
jgi:hypothetical protein